MLALAQQPQHRVKAASHGALPSIPSYANANNHILFFERFNSTFNIDLAQTEPAGKNWYTTNVTKNPTALCGVGAANPDPAWFTASGGVLTILTNVATPAACWSQEMSSFAWKSTNTSFQNYTIPGSAGFYIEGKFKFTPNCSQIFIPDFWLIDRLGAIAQIQGAGSFRFPEIDIFEVCGTSQTVQTVDDWTSYNTFTYVRSDADLSGIDYSKFHTWGMLLTTMAQGGGTGSIKWYVDRVQTGNAITWTQTSDFMGIAEQGNYVMNMGTGLGTPLSIEYIMVAVP